jgi:hypothetical protein
MIVIRGGNWEYMNVHVVVECFVACVYERVGQTAVEVDVGLGAYAGFVWQ